MYRIVVVEDEPAALKHICMIIQNKCPDYTVIDTAENGLDALKLIRKVIPDVVISDIKMPVMDGISLVSKLKDEIPEILSVIVSGYQDFEYAKGAIRSGVCDYLLKPLKPSDLAKLLDELKGKLDSIYYENRKLLVKKLSNGIDIADINYIKRYFPEENYYAALLRRNGLPRRFYRQNGIEIFSIEEEKFFLYGRDEKESMYLIPENLVFYHTFSDMMEQIYEREKNEISFMTAVISDKAFSINSLSKVLTQLYKKLDESIIIGENQFLGVYTGKESPVVSSIEKEKMQHIEYLAKYKESNKLLTALDELFEIWSQSKHTQLYVESNIRYIFHIIGNYFEVSENLETLEYMIDDAFNNAVCVSMLKDSILSLIRQFVSDLKENEDDKEKLIRSIIGYIDNNLEKTLTLSGICQEFGVSQTLLSKLFRTYMDASFSNYITQKRIEKAQQIMRRDRDAYIKEIAERVGYSDQFYFSRIFRSIVGVCPSEYLENLIPK